MRCILLFCLLAGLLGQAEASTCKSRCEDELGKGDARCEKMCAGFEDKPVRVSKAKAAQDDAAARAAFEAGASQGAARAASKASAASAAAKK